jgi:hypothetical protein
VAKHPPDPPRRQSIRLKWSSTRQWRQSICKSKTATKYPPTNRRAVKHPPDYNHYNPDDADETSEGRRRSGSSPRRADDHHHHLSLQDDASREGVTPQVPLSSDQKD